MSFWATLPSWMRWQRPSDLFLETGGDVLGEMNDILHLENMNDILLIYIHTYNMIIDILMILHSCLLMIYQC